MERETARDGRAKKAKGREKKEIKMLKAEREKELERAKRREGKKKESGR